MGKDFHVPFYFRDFLTSTDLMTNEEVGAHIRVLSHQADKGHLLEKEIVGRIGVPMWDSIRIRYRQDEAGLWFHPRMDAILTERADFIKSRLNNLHVESHTGSHVGTHAKDKDKDKDISKGKNSEELRY